MAEPARAIAHPDFGRLYAVPGTLVPGEVAEALRERAKDEEPAAKRDVKAATAWASNALAERLLVPSITNVIGVRNLPHLNYWYGRLAAEAAFEVAEKWPERVKADRRAAIMWCRNAGDRERDDAADHGTTVHEAAEAVAGGLPRPDGMNARHLAYFASWEAWVRQYQPEWVELEATVYSEKYGYMGTTDFIALIDGEVVCGDYKTSRSLHSEVALQLSAVRFADCIVNADGSTRPLPQIERGMAVHLTADGFFAPEATITPKVHSWFLGLRAAWDFHVTDGTVGGEPVLTRLPFRTRTQIAARAGQGMGQSAGQSAAEVSDRRVTLGVPEPAW